ncbi:unnamed protein product, partial [Symbiodinium sp. CCMP2456]
VAAAAVRCTNFVAEEQPTVHLVGNASRLLTDAALRVACAAEEEVSKTELPSFRCEIVEDESCAAGAGTPLEASHGLFGEESLSAFVFASAMEAPLALARQRWRQAGSMKAPSAGAVGWEAQAGTD